MTTVVKSKIPIVVPSAIQRRAGIKPGDRLEFKVSGGVISILSKRSEPADEYTPAQRRAIDEKLKQASAGPYYGPFQTADQVAEFLTTEIRKRKAAKLPTAE